MQNILIIGATSAVAKHFAQRAHARGDKLYCVARSEEKLAVLVRIAQLYSVLFFFYYEQWPSNTRKYLTIMFSGFQGSLYI